MKRKVEKSQGKNRRKEKPQRGRFDFVGARKKQRQGKTERAWGKW